MKEIIPEFKYWDKGLEEYRTFESLGIKEDWFSIVKSMAGLIYERFKNKTEIKWLLDIGSGDGCALFQILSFLPEDFKAKLSIDCLEPSRKAIDLMERGYRKNRDIGLIKNILIEEWKSGVAQTERYDIITMIHVNYYIASDRHFYNQRLIDLVNVLKPNGLGIILTLPKNSAYYNMARFAGYDYPNFIYAEYTKKALKKLNIFVASFSRQMRFRAPDTRKEQISFWSLVLHKCVEKPLEIEIPNQMDFKDEIIWFVKN